MNMIYDPPSRWTLVHPQQQPQNPPTRWHQDVNSRFPTSSKITKNRKAYASLFWLPRVILYVSQLETYSTIRDRKWSLGLASQLLSPTTPKTQATHKNTQERVHRTKRILTQNSYTHRCYQKYQYASISEFSSRITYHRKYAHSILPVAKHKRPIENTQVRVYFPWRTSTQVAYYGQCILVRCPNAKHKLCK